MKNSTAKISCFARGYHFKNNRIHIFADEFAEAMLGSEYEQIAESMKKGIGFFMPLFSGNSEDGLKIIVDNQLSPSVLGRSAFCEKMLENEERLGCTQYLMFASGYDTFGIRNKNPSLSVFELDRPQVLDDKKEKVQNARLNSSSVYVPCDLSDKSWKKPLLESGFCCSSKSFASLLGISYYLDKPEFGDLLLEISEIMCNGSAICFDYPSTDGGKETKTNRALAQEAGEPMKAEYSYSEMEKLLEECGFAIYEHLDSAEMTEQYFSKYNKNCPAHTMNAPDGVCYILAVNRVKIIRTHLESGAFSA